MLLEIELSVNSLEIILEFTFFLLGLFDVGKLTRVKALEYLFDTERELDCDEAGESEGEDSPAWVQGRNPSNEEGVDEGHNVGAHEHQAIDDGRRSRESQFN